MNAIETSAKLKPGDIVAFVEKRYSLPAGAIASIHRQEAFCRARQIAAWLIRELLGAHFKDIGLAMGNRHPTAAMASIQAAKDRIDVEKGFAEEIQGLKERLTS